MQDYHDQTVLRPVVIAQHSPGPLAHGLLGALPPRAIRNMALSGAITFVVVGVAGGFWIAAKYFESRIAAAEQQAQQAQQARQEAETRLASVQGQLKEFCTAVLSGQPPTQPAATPAPQQPSGTVAANPTP